MARRIDSLGEEFYQLFHDFGHTAYRLEALQSYAVDYEEGLLSRFLAGETQPADPSRDAWMALVRNAVASGKHMRRVHAVIEPLSDYLRYELTWYADSVAAGEDVRILPIASAADWPADLPRGDYWLFDSRDLWIMNYDQDGRFLHAELVTDAAQIVLHNYWRDLALHHAISFAEYLKLHPNPSLQRVS